MHANMCLNDYEYVSYMDMNMRLKYAYMSEMHMDICLRCIRMCLK